MNAESGDKTPLPAPDFCNSWGEGNPVLGKGALGNSSTGHMYYSDTGNREAMVKKVQAMLSALGYTLGSAGADGKFGNDTEKAVKKFQEEHEDWGGKKLNVDGLVGPKTADALNRKMVAKGWYKFHQTETRLTRTFSLLTIQAEALKSPVSLDVEGVKKGKVVIVDYSPGNPGNLLHISFILYAEKDRRPLANCRYRLYLSHGVVEGTTDKDGLIEYGRVKAGDYLLEIAGSRTYVPAISGDTARFGWMVLGSGSEGSDAV
jgi:hypothetical protein